MNLIWKYNRAQTLAEQYHSSHWHNFALTHGIPYENLVVEITAKYLSVGYINSPY